MTNHQIIFVTTNNIKFRKFMKVVPRKCQYTFEQLAIETPEIQANTSREVAQYSAKWASEKMKKPVIKEDIGVYIDALNGFPGPYLNHIEKQIGVEGFLQLLEGTTNRKAKYELCVAFCKPGEIPISFSTYIAGTIGMEARGEAGWIMDKLFIPDKCTKTIAELIDAKEFKRNEDHYMKLLQHILSE